MNYKVLIVNGAPQSGKDTFIDLLSKSGRYNVIKTSIIDPIKEISEFLNFNTENKTEKDRKLWADLLKATMDYNQYPITKTFKNIEDKLYNTNINNKDILICVIARNPKNIEIFKNQFKNIGINTTTVFINNNDKKIFNNIEDKSIYDYIYDLYIDNSGSLTELEETIEFVDWLEI